ncbi:MULTISPECIES: hypothetical protein [unclassified Rhizobium]|nr:MULTISPECIES: hypothetical protein [unclassified Rhizobium]MBB1247997.1 hypothetical protein [Rhizobium sp. G21]MCV3765292.1 hypothetical protein [Rhizobium sp. TRM95796]
MRKLLFGLALAAVVIAAALSLFTSIRLLGAQKAEPAPARQTQPSNAAQ